MSADRIGLESLDREGPTVVLKFRQDAKVDPALLLKLIKSRGDLTLLPPAVLRLDLKPRRPRLAVRAASVAPQAADPRAPPGGPPGPRR